MGKLKANAAFQRRHQSAVGERPIGHRLSGIVAGDQATGDHQQQGQYGYRYARTGRNYYPLNEKSCVLLSFGATVMVWSEVPYFSCQVSMV